MNGKSDTKRGSREFRFSKKQRKLYPSWRKPHSDTSNQPSKSTWSQSDSNPQLSEHEYRQYCSYNISSSNNNICVGCGVMVARLKSQKLVFGHAQQSPREYIFLIWKMRNIIYWWKRKTGALPLKADFNMGSSFKFSKMSAILVITAFSRPLNYLHQYGYNINAQTCSASYRGCGVLMVNEKKQQKKHREIELTTNPNAMPGHAALLKSYYPPWPWLILL